MGDRGQMDTFIKGEAQSGPAEITPWSAGEVVLQSSETGVRAPSLAPPHLYPSPLLPLLLLHFFFLFVIVQLEDHAHLAWTEWK